MYFLVVHCSSRHDEFVTSLDLLADKSSELKETLLEKMLLSSSLVVLSDLIWKIAVSY